MVSEGITPTLTGQSEAAPATVPGRVEWPAAYGITGVVAGPPTRTGTAVARSATLKHDRFHNGLFSVKPRMERVAMAAMFGARRGGKTDSALMGRRSDGLSGGRRVEAGHTMEGGPLTRSTAFCAGGFRACGPALGPPRNFPQGRTLSGATRRAHLTRRIRHGESRSRRRRGRNDEALTTRFHARGCSCTGCRFDVAPRSTDGGRPWGRAPFVIRASFTSTGSTAATAAATCSLRNGRSRTRRSRAARWIALYTASSPRAGSSMGGSAARADVSSAIHWRTRCA